MHIFEESSGVVTRTWDIRKEVKGGDKIITPAVDLSSIKKLKPKSNIHKGTATVNQVLYNGKFVDPVGFFRVVLDRVLEVYTGQSPDYVIKKHPEFDIHFGDSPAGHIKVDGVFVDPQPLALFENGKVEQTWGPGKSIAMIKKHLPDADIRYGDYVYGQIETESGVVDPPKSAEQIALREAEKTERAQLKTALGKLDDPDETVRITATKRCIRYILKHVLESE